MPVDSATPAGSITDVAGVHVGHFDRTGRGWRTGTTVVLAPGGVTAGVDVRGGGPGTRETDALRPENLVGTIHAICLTGGSAYGLAAADGVARWLEERQLGFAVGPDEHQIVPVVPAAVIFDLGRGGRFDHRPTAEFGYRAAANARTRQRRFGSVGAGTGAIAGGLQGGVGTASTTVSDVGDDPSGGDVTIGALAVVNANGTLIDPGTGLPWERAGFRVRRPPAAERAALTRIARPPAISSLNTTIGVIATDADLDPTEVTKLASVCHDGLARAVRPAHSMVDGDTIFAIATGDRPIDADDGRAGRVTARHRTLNRILDAAATAFAAACVHAVLAAEPGGPTPAYRDLAPSAWR